MSRGFKNSELSRIQNFGTFPNPKIRNLPGTINSGFYRKHKLGILSDSMICNARKHLRKQKSIKKPDVQIRKQRN